MKELGSLYVERNNCDNCYRCVRECALKAISIVHDGVKIDPVRCIGCGACIQVCKPGVIKLRNDVHLAREIIKKHGLKVASVSPQWVTEFEGLNSHRFVEALKLLGFDHVSESALGAESTIRAEHAALGATEGVGISARCPAVVDYILKHRPRLKPVLLSVLSPMAAHAKMIRSWWGAEAAVVHISACIAAKNEAEQYSDTISTVLTFRELKKWMHDEGIQTDKLSGNTSYRFEPHEAAGGIEYPLCGALKADGGAVTIASSSIGEIKRVLDMAPVKSDKTLWLDFMVCSGGCLGSSGSGVDKVSRLNQRVAFEKQVSECRDKATGYALPNLDMSRVWYDTPTVDNFVSEGETVGALDSIGLSAPTKQTDCGACGFGTCRRFAKALSRGYVTKELCWQFINVEVRSKFMALLSRLSSGVAIINAEMRIEEANRLIVTMVRPEAELMFDATPGLRGVSAATVFPFSSLIKTALENGDDTIVRDIQIKERIITVSVHTIQKYSSVIVICRNMLFSQVRNEEIVKRTQRVVRENLATVQQIAYLLGENASRTEAILNSILNAQSREDE